MMRLLSVVEWEDPWWKRVGEEFLSAVEVQKQLLLLNVLCALVPNRGMYASLVDEMGG